VADRLRDLIDLVLASLDERGADGRALAERAHFSRDHLDRLLAAATGESPMALRRRLLLERAAWQLRAGVATASEAAAAADYGSLAAFSRAFARAYGEPPSEFARSPRAVALDAPNGIHFHPPAGLLLPRIDGVAGGPPPAGAGRASGAAAAALGRDLTERMVSHHLGRSRELLALAADLPAADLDRPLRPGLTILEFEGEEPSAAAMAERLVYTLEIWVAAAVGEQFPPRESGPPLARLDRVAPRFERFARRVRDGGAWDDAFVDALCEPPQSFTYGGVIAHVLTYGAIRREALAGVLAELGAAVPDTADPILWEARRR
jgi:AraC family transcriptional regulator